MNIAGIDECKKQGNTKKWLVDDLRQATGNPNIAFPSKGIIATKFGDLIQLHLSSGAVADANMQADSAAFEAWALCIRRWLPTYKIELSWDKPDASERQHYQRFLFRVFNFVHLFGDWVCLREGLIESIQKEAKFISVRGNLFVNSPNKLRPLEIGTSKKIGIDILSENDLEILFAGRYAAKLLTPLSISDPEIVCRQIPVGLFDGPPAGGKEIFTGKKSAIDLVAYVEDRREVICWELKKPGNKKMGIISESLFYAFFVREIAKGKFKLYEPDWCQRNFKLGNISMATQVTTYLLVHDIHSLIDDKLVEVINEAFGRLDPRSPRMKLGIMQYDKNFACRIVY